MPVETTRIAWDQGHPDGDRTIRSAWRVDAFGNMELIRLDVPPVRRRNVASTVECPICLEQVRRAELYCHKCEEG